MGKGLEDLFLQRRCTDGRQAREKRLTSAVGGGEAQLKPQGESTS